MPNSTEYARKILKIVVAQLSKTIGFQSAQTVSLDVLGEILEYYILLLCKSSREHAELASRTEPTLEDVAVTFDRLKITIGELEDFATNVDIPKFSGQIIQFPNPKENKLGFVDDPNNEEIQERLNDEEKEHIYEYFPLMKKINEPLPTLMTSINESSGLNNEKSGENMEEQQQEVNLTINGVQFEKSKWISNYESVKNLRRGMQDLDLTKPKNQPKEAQEKFPPTFHKAKSKFKKYSINKVHSIEAEDEQNESAIIDDAKVNIPTNIDISQLNQPDSKSFVDDMIDAVVTKYSAQTSRLSPTHHHHHHHQQQPQHQTIEDISIIPKIKAKIQPERLIDDIFSPIKINDTDDSNKQMTMKTPQLKLKIPLNRPLNEQQVKQQKKANKGLKLIIDKKRVINTEQQQQPQVIENESETVLDLSFKSSKASKEDLTIKKPDNSISFNIDADENNAEENEDHLNHPLFWKPTCDTKQQKQSYLENSSATSSPLIPNQNFSLFSSLFSNKEAKSGDKLNKSNDQLDFSFNQSEKHEILTQTIFTPLKLSDTIEDSTLNKTGNQDSQIDHRIQTPIVIDEEGGTKHKKHKKDKDKKHKKERHEKSEKKKHKLRQNEEENKMNEHLEEIVKIEQQATPPLPKIKLKLGGNPTAEVVKPLKLSNPFMNEETPETKKPSSNIETKPSTIPKLLIKPIIDKSKKPPPPQQSLQAPLKLKLKIEKTDQNEQNNPRKDESSYINMNTEANNPASKEPSKTTSASNIVDVITIDDNFGSMNEMEIKVETELHKKDLFKDDLLEKLDEINRADKAKKNKNKQLKNEQINFNIENSILKKEPGFENYITQEQLISITETINSVSMFNNRSGSLGGDVRKKDKKKDYKKDFNFQNTEPIQSQQSINELSKLKIDKKNRPSSSDTFNSIISNNQPFATEKPSNTKKINLNKTKSDISDHSKKVIETKSMFNLMTKPTTSNIMPIENVIPSASVPVLSTNNLQTTQTKIIDESMPLDKILTSISSVAALKQSTITGTTEIYDEVWICPSCKNNDDGTPMIGCDSCDDWYHWSCVGINLAPPENQPWYCNKCNFNDSSKRKKKKKS